MNRDRFPEDFVFQLDETERTEVVANCDHLKKLKYSAGLPYAFTEHAALMAASILNSPVAIQASIQIVRSFVKLRGLLTSHRELALRLDTLERKYDAKFMVVFDAIRQLMREPDKVEPPKRKIGFLSE